MSGFLCVRRTLPMRREPVRKFVFKANDPNHGIAGGGILRPGRGARDTTRNVSSGTRAPMVGRGWQRGLCGAAPDPPRCPRSVRKPSLSSLKRALSMATRMMTRRPVLCAPSRPRSCQEWRHATADACWRRRQ